MAGLVLDGDTCKLVASKLVLAGEAPSIELNKLIVDRLAREPNQQVIDPDENSDQTFRAMADEEAGFDDALHKLADVPSKLKPIEESGMRGLTPFYA